MTIFWFLFIFSIICSFDIFSKWDWLAGRENFEVHSAQFWKLWIHPWSSSSFTKNQDQMPKRNHTNNLMTLTNVHLNLKNIFKGDSGWAGSFKAWDLKGSMNQRFFNLIQLNWNRILSSNTFYLQWRRNRKYFTVLWLRKSYFHFVIMKSILLILVCNGNQFPFAY